VLKRGRKVLRLKDKHPSYCGSPPSISFSVCQLHSYKPIEQNNSRRVALPTASLSESLLAVLSLTLVSCTATLSSVHHL
jgi:hypothetical protein